MTHEEILNSRREKAARETQERQAAIQRAKLSHYAMVQVSPRLFAIIVDNGCCKMGEDPYCQQYKFLEGWERREYWSVRAKLARLRREEEENEPTQVGPTIGD